MTLLQNIASVAARKADRTIRVASVPSRHVYVEHLAAMQPTEAVAPTAGVERLPDPRPAGDGARTGRWWPPTMLTEAWVHSHAAEFDVFHLHFGFDSYAPADLLGVVRALRAHGIPLVYTVHDLRNPHHDDPAAHQAHLDVLVPNADALITLTPGAADAVAQRWGRRPTVLPHPHVVPLDRLATTARARRDEYVVGVHAKSLRACTDPAAVVSALLPLRHELPGLRLLVDVHREVAGDDASPRAQAMMQVLRGAYERRLIELRVHDYFTDDELWDYLGSLDASVLPYRFGTHSGWLEACRDLGTTAVAPDCGFFAEQGPCLSYGHDESGLDAESLRDAVRTGYRTRQQWFAGREARMRERDELAHAHHDLYAGLLADARAAACSEVPA